MGVVLGKKGGGGGGGGARARAPHGELEQALAARTWPKPGAPMPVPARALRSTSVTPAPVAAVTTPCASGGAGRVISGGAGTDGTPYPTERCDSADGAWWCMCVRACVG